MIKRRNLLQAASAAIALSAVPVAFAQAKLPQVTVYLSPGCDCCHRWLTHMRANGFELTTISLENVVPLKRTLGVPERLDSCHTAVLDGHVIEGHVPASDVKRLLRERSAKGLAVPGMVAGSPGMEGGTAKAYATIAFDEAGSRIFERH